MRAGVYTRLSSLKPTEELTSLGLERQSEDTLKLAAERGYEVVRTYSDPGRSGADDVVRPEFEQALRDLADSTIDVLVIPSFDRLTRGLKTWIRIRAVLEASGGKIVSVADGDLDGDSPLVSIRAVFAEDEIRRTSRRVTRWHAQRAHAGKPLVSGARPYGYATKDRSVTDEVEAEVIRAAAELILRGKPLHAVAAWANELGATSPTGKLWRANTFGKMICSPGVAGLRFHQGVEVATGTWEPILDRATWEAVRMRLQVTKRGGRPPKALLAGIIRCEVCGRRMTTGYRPRDHARQYRCYVATGIEPRCGKAISAEPVEELVAERVLDRLEITGVNAALASLGDGQAEAAAAELADAERDRNELEQMRASGAIKNDAFLRMHGPAEERVEAARRALRASSSRSALSALPTDPDELRAWWYDPDTSVEERREVLRAVLDRVVIQPSGPRMNTFDPERVVIPKDAWKV
jgi:site-specific DNA recombinase